VAGSGTAVLNDGTSAPARSRTSLETRIWVATGSASIGDGLRLAALPLAVAAITRDPLQVAGLTVAQRIPPLLLVLPAGVILDRVDPLHVLVACQRIRVGLVLALAGTVAVRALLTAAPLLAAVYLLAVLLAATEVFGDVAAQVVVQLVVADERLEHTNSRVVAAQLLGEEFIGPPAGGWLFGLGRWPAFVGIGVAYAVSALVLAGGSRQAAGQAAGQETPSIAASTTARSDKAGRREAVGGILGEARQGLAVVTGHRDLLVQASWTSVMNAGNGVVGAVFVLFALEDLRLSGTAYGALLTAGGIGGVLGAAMAGIVIRRVPRTFVMIMTSLLASLCTLVLGSVRSVVVVFALQGSAALCGVLFSVRRPILPAVDHTGAVRRPHDVGVPPAEPRLAPAGCGGRRRPGHGRGPRRGDHGRRGGDDGLHGSRRPVPAPRTPVPRAGRHDVGRPTATACAVGRCPQPLGRSTTRRRATRSSPSSRRRVPRRCGIIGRSGPRPGNSHG
jgi:Major Facilitator Superfamily